MVMAAVRNQNSWTQTPNGKDWRFVHNKLEEAHRYFNDSHKVVTLTEDEMLEFGPWTKASISSGGYREFGLCDLIVYSGIADLAFELFEDDEFQQKFFIASYFKQRGISWGYLTQ
jgi:hypothetical protein